MAWSWVIYSFLYKKLVIVSTILGKKYILRQAVRKINFPHMWWIFPWGKLFFHTLSLIKGCEEKKSKCVENGHYPVEKTRKIQEKYLVGSVMGVWISNSCDVLRYELRLGSPDGSWWLSVLDFLNFSVNLLRQFDVTEFFFWLFWSPARSPPRLFVSKSSSFFRRVEPLKVFLAAESRSKRPLPIYKEKN